MPSAKQIKARKLFAKRVKRGDFKKAISKSKKSKSSSNPHNDKTEKKGHISKFLYQSLVKDLQRNTKKLNDVRNDPRVNYYGGYKQKQEHIAYLQNVVAENKKIIQANHP